MGGGRRRRWRSCAGLGSLGSVRRGCGSGTGRAWPGGAGRWIMCTWSSIWPHWRMSFLAAGRNRIKIKMNFARRQFVVTCSIMGSAIPPKISSCTQKYINMWVTAWHEARKWAQQKHANKPLLADIRDCKIHVSEFQMPARTGQRRKLPIEFAG